MDWIDGFDELTASQRLTVATMLAEHVLPLEGGSSALAEGLQLVWLQTGGRATSKQELTRALNTAIEEAELEEGDHSARAHAARATFAVIEAALHNPAAAAEAVQCALSATRAYSASAADEEQRWLDWAISVAQSTELPTRSTFGVAGAPTLGWVCELSSDNLPLFGAPD